MNIKKEYEAPKMTILEIQAQTNLLSCSSCGGPDADEYDDEFGIDITPRNDRQV